MDHALVYDPHMSNEEFSSRVRKAIEEHGTVVDNGYRVVEATLPTESEEHLLETSRRWKFSLGQDGQVTVSKVDLAGSGRDIFHPLDEVALQPRDLETIQKDFP